MALKNLFGDLGLDSTLQKMAQYLQQIASNIARVYPDPSGSLRVIPTGGTVTAVTTVTTVSTVSNVNNISGVGGFQTNYDQYSAMQGNADCIRSRVTTS